MRDVEPYRALLGLTAPWRVADVDMKGQAVAMDMWEPCAQSPRAHLPGAGQQSVFDKFHVGAHLHDAVDRVRCGEHRALKRGGDGRLTGSKYLWLRRPEELNETQRAAFRLGVSLPRLGPPLLHALVLARDAWPAHAHGGRRPTDRAPPAEPACFHCGGLDLYPHENR